MEQKNIFLSLTPYTKFIDYAVRKLFLDAVYESFFIGVYIYIYIYCICLDSVLIIINYYD